MINSNFDQAAANRRGVLQLVVLTLAFAAALYLLHLPTPFLILFEAAVVVLIGIRIWSPGELDSAHEYALVIVTGFPIEAVAAIGQDARRAAAWQRSGVRTDRLARLRPADATAVAAAVARSARPRIRWPYQALAGLAGALVAAIALIVAPPSCLRLPWSVVGVYAGVAVVVVVSRVYLRLHSGRQRTQLRAHFARDPRRLVADDLNAILAPAESAKQAAVVTYLNQLSGATPPHRTHFTTVVVLLLPAVITGAVGALWLVGLARSCG